MAERIERTERLLNLVMCLMASRTGVSRSAIERQIPGYAAAASPAAFERMFERDKDELRSMGIPVDTVTDSGGDVVGYRIPEEDYALRDLDLTVGERAAIAVAAQVWSQAVAGPVAGTALRKLETIEAGLEQWAPADLHGSVQLTARDAALLPLMSAIRQDRTVTFPYRTPTDDAAHPREVSPWGLRSSSGRWFLVGFDHARGGTRTFRLSRIAGPVTVTARPRAQQPPPDFDISASDGNTNPDDRPVVARIRVTAGRAAALRRLALPDEPAADPLTADVIHVGAPSIQDLVSLVCAAGPDAFVIEPPSVVDAVVAALTELAGPPDGDPS